MGTFFFFEFATHLGNGPYLRLIGESEINSKCRVNISDDLARLGESDGVIVEDLHVGCVQLD